MHIYIYTYIYHLYIFIYLNSDLYLFLYIIYISITVPISSSSIFIFISISVSLDVWCQIKGSELVAVAVLINVLGALTWPNSQQREVNVHKQSTWLIWLISSLLSSLTLATQQARGSQQEGRELVMGEINWSTCPIESDSWCCLIGGSRVSIIVALWDRI